MSTWSKSFVRTPLVLLALAEASILYLSVNFASSVAMGGVDLFEDSLGPIAPKAAAFSTVMLLSLVAMGLYQFHQRAYFHEVLVRIVVGMAIGSAILGASYYFFPRINLEPRIAALSVLSALTLLLLLRLVFLRYVDENIFRRRTLVFGAGERSEAITDLRRRADRRGFRIVGTIPAPGDTLRGNRADLLETGVSICDTAEAENADEIVIAMDDRRGNLPIRELLDCKMRGIEVLDLLEFLERETGKIQVDLVSPGWLIFSPGFRHTRLRRLLKRGLDLVVGSIALCLAWPFMILIIVAIKLEDGLNAPVIYRQRRVGYRDRAIDVLKFRSMVVDAEADGEAVWAIKDDPRVTRVGALLRKIRFDELPQIFNVLSGNMSLVGPRPERPEFVEDLEAEIPYYAERHGVKPGLTGWAQLKYSYGASKEDAIEKLRYDLYYVKNHSLLLDLAIILQTVEVILWRKGAR